MKRKWLIIIIPLAVLGVFLIVIWPMAPLWQKMGGEPICIQGDWPDLHLVPCSGQQAASIVAVPLPTPGAEGPIPIIVDDDGSPDGMVALLYFLRNPMYEVRAVTVSYGEAHPERFAGYVAQMLAAFDRAEIPVGFGRDAPFEGANAFPDSWREGSDNFWGIEVPKGSGATTPVPAAELMAEIVAASERPVTVFVSGSHTNLAEALRLDAGIAANIGEVFIMGGSVRVAGNIHSDWPEFENEVAEWNIWVDPLAADEVFSAGLGLHLVPLDATRQVLWTGADLTGWRSSGAPESALAAELVQMTLDAWGVESVYVWDLVAAVQATLPAVCPETPLGIEIVTAPGAEQGRTREVEQTPNVSVCLEPDAGQAKGLVASAFEAP
ncbi:MAG: nucleoside hydrolase [Anaerolineales bacterium]|nr:nucleoside hydrolase [Anaerolineales bacterium]